MNTVCLTMTQRKPVWVFPRDRFVIYEPRDELWARPLGFGREELRECTLTIPNAVITGIDPATGALQFVALPSD